MQQSLDYLGASQNFHGAPAGKDLLTASSIIARPRIGGFYPSVMGGIVGAGPIVGGLAFMQARRLLNTPTRKRGGGKKENWTRNRGIAKDELVRYGKGNPSASNIQKYAALKRKLDNPKFDRRVIERELQEFVANYRVRKATRKVQAKAKKPAAVPVAKGPVHLVFDNNGKVIRKTGAAPSAVTRPLVKPVLKPVVNRKVEAVVAAAAVKNLAKAKRAYTQKNTGAEWRSLLNRAKQDLSVYGKPTVRNVTRYASALRGQRANRLAPQTVISEFQTRVLPPPSELPPPSPEPPVTGPPPPPFSKAEALRANKNAAKTVLSSYGKPSGRDVITFTALSRKRSTNANAAKRYNDWLRNYQTRKAKAAFRPISEETARASSSF